MQHKHIKYKMVAHRCSLPHSIRTFAERVSTELSLFPFEIEFLDDQINKELLNDFKGERSGFCTVGPQKWVLPAAYALHAEKYYDLPLRKDDIWLITYPRSGTTVCQELVWMINNGFDYDRSYNIPLESRFPFYEFGILHHKELHNELIVRNEYKQEVIDLLSSWRVPGYIFAPQMESPRHLKTHLPFSLLPNLTDTCKTIYIARNPKDVAVSYYHHNRLLSVHGYAGDFKKYWKYFKNNLLVYSPYWEHINEGWQRRNEPNVLFIFYENLIKDMANEIKNIANFLNKDIDSLQIEALVNHLQIDNFREKVKIHKDVPIDGIMNPNEQGFIRKGKVGNAEEYTPDLLDEVNKWVEDNVKRAGFIFPSY